MGREKKGLYDPRHEHDSCGVGFLARLDAQPSHQIVADAVQILVNLEHRGAVGADQRVDCERTGSGIEDQIGRQLRSLYDDVLAQPVPDRFLTSSQRFLEAVSHVDRRS